MSGPDVDGTDAPSDGTDIPPDETDVPPDGTPERAPGGNLFRVLRVARNARIGAVAGVALAALAYAVRVAELLGPFRGTQRYPMIGEAGWFLVLAFVLGASTALLVTVVLTAWRATRLARQVDADEGPGPRP